MNGGACRVCTYPETENGLCVYCIEDRKQTPKPAPAAPERPEPQPHNLDAPGVREPLTRLEARVFDVIRQGGFFTPHCHWSEALIAAKVGVSRRTITRIKPRLVAKGWLRWKRVWRPGSRWQHCVYEILAGWHRPHRKTVMRWLDERRCRANVSLNELPPHIEGEETQRRKSQSRLIRIR